MSPPTSLSAKCPSQATETRRVRGASFQHVPPWRTLLTFGLGLRHIVFSSASSSCTSGVGIALFAYLLRSSCLEWLWWTLVSCDLGAPTFFFGPCGRETCRRHAADWRQLSAHGLRRRLFRIGARRAPGGALPLAVVSRRKRERGRSTAQRRHVLTCTCMRGR